MTSKVCVYLLGKVAGDDSCAEVCHNVGDEDHVGECVEDDDLRRRVVAEERHDHRQDEHVQAQHEQHHQVPIEPARARPLMQERRNDGPTGSLLTASQRSPRALRADALYCTVHCGARAPLLGLGEPLGTTEGDRSKKKQNIHVLHCSKI